MTLSIEGISLNGRKARKPSLSFVRELTGDDLETLTEERGEQKPISRVKRLGERHQNLARLLASGVPAWEAAIITGYTESYISVLQGDKTFQNLILFYRTDRDDAVKKAQAQLAGLSVDVIQELQRRIEDEPEDFSVGQLVEVGKLALDRSGNGPASATTNTQININLADRLEAARKRLSERTIEGKVNDEGHEVVSAGSQNGTPADGDTETQLSLRLVD
jgi:hypothetical protein